MNTSIDRDKERLFKDLLPILDALDQACLHWEEARSLYQQEQADRSPRPSDTLQADVPPLNVPNAPPNATPSDPPQRTLWKTLWRILQTPLWANSVLASERSSDPPLNLKEVALNALQTDVSQDKPPTSFNDDDPEEFSWEEILESGQEGAELIRKMVLDLLKQRKVIPLNAVGKPFDGKYMVALGRDHETERPANTVTQEVVRGYLWDDRILREAQVIVAYPKLP